MKNIVFTQLSIPEVRGLLREELAHFFSSNQVRVKPDEENQKIVDLDGLIKARPFIGSRSTIYKKVSAGQIPHSKRGKRLIFDLNVIDQWLLANKVKTTEEIETEANNYLRRKRKGLKR